MSVVVFVGPTLPVEDCRDVLDVVYLPPASQGDVYRVALERPRAIAIIDGYFERMPAVWHKEILWALSQGIHVFGAASMGALRAAELADFGMVGVGKIFQAFREGVLEDDDEVTLVHGEGRHGYVKLSDAMVDIRATLARAEQEGLLSAESHARLLAEAKRLHYSERNLSQLLNDPGLSDAQREALRAWLPEGEVHQKREDALALLRFLKGWMGEDPAPKAVDFVFEHTDAWDQVSRRSGRQLGAARPDRLPLDLLLEEVRLEPGACQRASQDTLARFLALEEADRRGFQMDAGLFRETVNAFRLERGLLEPADLLAWMEGQGLDKNGFAALMERETRLRWVQRLLGPDAERLLADHLRMEGTYGRLASRTGHKQQVLTAHHLENPGLDDCPLGKEELLQTLVPPANAEESRDVEVLARQRGFQDGESFLQALVREYWYRQHG